MQEICDLIARAASPDAVLAERQAAFDELVRRYQGLVYGCAYAVLGDFQAAEDATQETFLLAWLRLEDLENPEALAGWLRRLVLTQCNRSTRRKRVNALPLGEAFDIACPISDPPGELERRELKQRVWEAIRELPERERVVVTLFYMGQHPQQEIARFLDVALTTVKKRLHSARTRLRKEMMDMVEETLQQEPLAHDFTAQIAEYRKAMKRLKKSGSRERMDELMASVPWEMWEEMRRLGQFQKFKETSRDVCRKAHEMVAASGSPQVHPEHLLLGLLRQDDPVVCQILAVAGVTEEMVTGEIDAITYPQVESAFYSPATKHVLELSAKEAKLWANRRNVLADIFPAHILTALLRGDEHLAGEILRRRGLTLKAVRAQVFKLT